MEENAQLKKEIKNLIASGDTEDALALLATKNLGSQENELIILSNRFNKLDHNLSIGIISSEAAGIELNKINNGILTLTDKIGTVKPTAINKKKAAALLPSFLIAIVLGISILLYLNNCTGEEVSPTVDVSEHTQTNTVEQNDEAQAHNIEVDSQSAQTEGEDGQEETISEPSTKIENKIAKEKTTPKESECSVSSTREHPKSPEETANKDYLEKGLLLIGMKDYDRAKTSLEQVSKTSFYAIHARNALDWIGVMRNFDLLYSGPKMEVKENIIMARCILPARYDHNVLVEPASVTEWNEMFCGDASFLSKLDNSTIKTIQCKLKDEGFYFGEVDGLNTRILRASIKIYYRHSSCLSGDPLDCAFLPEDYIESKFFDAIGINRPQL